MSSNSWRFCQLSWLLWISLIEHDHISSVWWTNLENTSFECDQWGWGHASTDECAGDAHFVSLWFWRIRCFNSCIFFLFRKFSWQRISAHSLPLIKSKVRIFRVSTLFYTFALCQFLRFYRSLLSFDAEQQHLPKWNIHPLPLRTHRMPCQHWHE